VNTLCDERRFRHPNGESYLLLRAVTLDNWITWRDVLPKNPQSRELLSEYQAGWIEPLALTLHRILECSWPGASKLGESPFKVDRWFDPHDPGTPWEEGRCCQFSVREVSPERFVANGRKLITPRYIKLGVNLAGWIQAELLAVPPLPKGRAKRK
jgi:hypothetical protein